MLLLATSQGKSKTSGGIISDSLDENKIRDRELLRIGEVSPNNNICFPIGTILTVQKQHEKLGFQHVFSKYNKKGRDLNSLITALVSYKLTDNFSICKASEWIIREEVLELFELDEFQERTLFRALETIGENREEIIADIQDCLFQ